MPELNEIEIQTLKTAVNDPMLFPTLRKCFDSVLECERKDMIASFMLPGNSLSNEEIGERVRGYREGIRFITMAFGALNSFKTRETTLQKNNPGR